MPPIQFSLVMTDPLTHCEYKHKLTSHNVYFQKFFHFFQRNNQTKIAILQSSCKQRSTAFLQMASLKMVA